MSKAPETRRDQRSVETDTTQQIQHKRPSGGEMDRRRRERLQAETAQNTKALIGWYVAGRSK